MGPRPAALPAPLLEGHHLRLLVALREQGSLTLAARTLGVTPSALSHQLREIARLLGISPFERRGRRFVATRAGLELASAAATALEELRHVAGSLRGARNSSRGRLRLGAESQDAYPWLARAVREYRERFPGAAVELDVDARGDAVAALRQGRLDVAILENGLGGSRLPLVRLFGEELLLVVPRAHRLAARPYVVPGDLEVEALLLRTSADTRQPGEALKQAGFRAARSIRIESKSAVLELVRAGIGLGVCRRSDLQDGLPSGLTALRLGRGGTRLTWYAVTRAGQGGSGSLRKLLALLRQHGRASAAGGRGRRSAVSPRRLP